VLHDLDRPIVGERPDRFGGVGEERRLGPNSRSYYGRAAPKSRTRRPAKRRSDIGRESRSGDGCLEAAASDRLTLMR